VDLDELALCVHRALNKGESPSCRRPRPAMRRPSGGAGSRPLAHADARPAAASDVNLIDLSLAGALVEHIEPSGRVRSTAWP